jgi:type II secretory pathway component GspD/PulD (secretin)
VARVPRIGESVTSIAEAVGNLGATNIHADPASGLLSFAADYRTHERLKEYMRTFENGRDMIVYDVWILEIKLDESSQIGVNWKSLTELSSDGLQLNFGMSSTTLASGLNLGLISEGDASSLEAVLQFLEEHGSAKTLARPTVTVMSGREASFNVGESREYISEVTISTVLDDDDDDAIQVTTSTLETGLNVVFGGSHDNGIVHTDVSIEINNLIEFQQFSTTAAGEGTELLLPHTANRKYETAVDARPGDILVIGGLIQEAAEDGDTRIYGTDVPVSNSHKGSRSELVMMLRPRLVKIRPAEPKPHPIVSH